MRGQLLQLGRRVLRQLSLLARYVGLLRIALRADRHVFTQSHRHRPRHETFDASHRIDDFDALEAATPIIRLAVETIASSEPSTAARSQPTRPLRCSSARASLWRLECEEFMLRAYAAVCPRDGGHREE
jgi:hypothetical protein